MLGPVVGAVATPTAARPIARWFQRHDPHCPQRCPRTLADTFSAAVEALERQGVGRERVAELLGTALNPPILTAHPTEVRRKSIIYREAAIAELIIGA
jgi:phosphoenolpyruvate carboxylase